ncbi:MAG: class Ib ribonucleoside-diphosphate reductase assembly flavoprotein NrdI [Cellulomonas sp.]|uniref:class Ib ribonucleoside-diphosphate reductase assembly flavoprotein NrdI n=1 Tax=Cellulomonas sp. TaxID=40001 RepID=UPI0017CB10A7|nr:class Ib ribonucleoside-diphosphate reductase assembly flavoprotein NrdI [Cellulomonas sp.]NMM31646.1 class Ib ribonucleoside-diphosphate reductase assembly flavoprotein NrdI [Cellulomonas sp.]
MRQTPIYYYSSSSGLVRSFAERLARPVFNLAERAHRVSEADGPWVLLTPSYTSGNDRNDTVPEGVLRFLASAVNRRRMVGVIGSGNRNFGVHYQRACRVVAARSGRPVLFEFELSGTPWDVEECQRIMVELDEALAAHGETPHDTTPSDETPKGRPVD